MTVDRKRKQEVKRGSGKLEWEELTPATPTTDSLCAAASLPSFLWNWNSRYNYSYVGNVPLTKDSLRI